MKANLSSGDKKEESGGSEVIQTGVILPKSASSDATLPTSFSFQFGDTGSTQPGHSAPIPLPSQSPVPTAAPASSAAPNTSLESTYLSTVNLSDVLGKLLPSPAANNIPNPSSNNNIPPQPRLTDEWEYLDPQNEIQGPFPSKNMRRWLESGYFKMDLPIRLRQWSRFYPLGRLYPNLDFAFQQLLPEPGTTDQLLIENQRRQALLEQQKQALLEQQRQQAIAEQQRQQAMLEQQRQQAIAEQQRQQALLEQQRQQMLLEQQRQQQLLLEQQRQQQVILEQQQYLEQQKQRQLAEAKPAPWVNATANASHTKSLTEIQNEEEAKLLVQKTHSSKLKSLLGVTSNSNDGSRVWSTNTELTTTVSTPKQAKSLKEIQNEEQQELIKQQQLLLQQQQQFQKRMHQQKLDDEAIAAAAKTVPLTWGNPVISNTNTTQSKLSLKDIMKEEQVSQPAVESKPNSWAAKAKSSATSAPLSTAAAVSTLKTTLDPHTDTKTAISATSTNTQNQDAKLQNTEKGTSNKPSNESHPSTSATNKSSSEFGGKGMTNEFAEFCMTSMHRLNGSYDITLLEFCMSLKSPAEIREYLAAYLGSKPEVGAFINSTFPPRVI